MAFIEQAVTAAGRALLAKAQLGATIAFTRLAVGDGYMPVGTLPEDMTGLTSAVADVPISRKIRDGDSTTIGGDFSGGASAAGFWYRELGLFADDPDVGEILYCYGNAGDLAEYIPPVGGAYAVEKSVDVITVISSSLTVTAYIDPLTEIDTSRIYDGAAGKFLDDVLDEIRDDITTVDSGLETHVDDKNNPHEVTPAQIGSMTEAQIRDLVAQGSFLTYAGVVSASDPTGTMTPNPSTPNYWYQSSTTTFPTSFPVAVKSWDFATSAWVDAQYTPTSGDVWSNLNVAAGTPNGAYWFSGAWNQLDFHIDLSPYRTAADQDVIDAGLTSAASGAETQAVAYTTCATAAATVAKTTGTITGWTRKTGSRVTVTFTSGNTAASPTLNVSGTGAAAIRCDGAAITADMLPPGHVAEVVFDGTYWLLLNPAPTYKQVALTLAAASWTGSAAPYTYTITTTDIRITATSLQVVKFTTTDTAVAKAVMDADIVTDDSAQATNTVVLKANKTKPTVAIPVLLISLNDRI
jgi:hypothetical protein